MLTSLGLDVSATATGVVRLGASATKQPVLLSSRVIKPKSTGIVRAKEIVTDIMEEITETKPDRIVVEGYSIGKNANATIPLVEIGGILRLCLHLDGWEWYDPRASELKKFVSGKGNSTKEVMIKDVFKRWGFETDDNNIADAYGLACMGLALAGQLPGRTQEMLTVIGNLKKRSG